MAAVVRPAKGRIEKRSAGRRRTQAGRRSREHRQGCATGIVLRQWTIAVDRRRLASLRENTLAHRGERDATFLPMPPKRRSKPRQALPQRVAYGSRPRVLTRGPDQADQARGNPGLAHLCKSHGIRRLGRLRRAKLARFLHRGASDLWVPARLTLRAVEMSADVACPLS